MGRKPRLNAINESRNEGLERLWRELSREVLDFVDDRDWLTDARKAEKEPASKEATDTPAKG